jgi:hypothetical protein
LDRQLKFCLLGKAKGGQQKLLFLPLPRQTEALEAVFSQQYRRLLYGGAAGGGKSKFLRWLAYICCMRFKNFNVLLLRRSWPELEATHIKEAIREAPLIGAKCTPTLRTVVFADTGSVLKFGHCHEKKDMEDFLSTEYDLILFDELVTFLEDMYLLISSRARSGVVMEGWSPMVVATTNPGGPGSAWVSELFIDKVRDPKQYPTYDPKQHHFIKALLDDNPFVSANYVEFLMELPPEMREAYRWGRWDLFPGQYFKEFRRHRHVARIWVPPDIPRICGMDWGYLRPGVILWAVPLPDGRLYIEREYVFRETLIRLVAQYAVALTRIWGWTVSQAVGDPAMAIRQAESGEDLFETMQKEGWYVSPAKHERLNGWQRVRDWLRPMLLPDPTTGKPKPQAALIISPDCEYLIRTLPQLMQDEAKLEDIDTTGEDHAADALRYLVMSRPSPFDTSQKLLYAPDSAGALLQDLLNQASASDKIGSSNTIFR